MKNQPAEKVFLDFLFFFKRRKGGYSPNLDYVLLEVLES